MTQIWHWTSLELDHQQKAGGVEKHIQQTSASLKSRGYEVSWGLSPPEQWLRQHSNEPLFVHTHGDFLVNPLFIRKLRARLLG